jgi:hypothetical protein
MADFHVRSDSVDVEQVMRQIRARIREKRGADYTEAELQHLASVKLEKLLDPRGVRSNLVEAFRNTRVASPEPAAFVFTDETLFESPRPWLQRLRRLLSPILRLFINQGRLSGAFRAQQSVNADVHQRFRAREEMDQLYYEVVHNLVLEITRLGIETQNLKMRVESLSSRLDFDERRSRSLEATLPRRHESPPHRQAPPPPMTPAAPRPSVPSGSTPPQGSPASPVTTTADGGSTSAATAPLVAAHFSGQGPRTEEQRERRRRRRRRRRRPGQTMATGPGGAQAPGSSAPGGAAGASDRADQPDQADHAHGDYDEPGSDEADDGPEDEGGGPEGTHQ